MDIVFLAFFLLTAFEGVIAQVQLEPKTSAVLRGTDARFNCSLSQTNWVAMTWLLNSSVVLTISEKFGVLENSGRYTAFNYTTDQSHKWEFVLRNAQWNESGVVTCDVQNIGRKTAALSVQESGTVTITSGNVTAKRNQPATIRCLARGWLPEPDLTWTLGGISVNQDKYNTSTEALGGLFNSASTLTLLANYSAPVECRARVPALAVPQTSTIFLTIDPESGTVTITSGNVTAKRNQPVTIRCLARGWFPEPDLTWTLGGISVNQDKYNTSTEALGGLFNSASTLTLLANYSAPVECRARVPALAVPQTSTIFLTIVADTAEKDQTVLIAVVVSVVAVALLVLLIIGIIFCYKRRKATKSSYEEEVRRTRSLSERNASEVVQGKDNMAYLPDGSKQDVAPSEFNDSGIAQTISHHTLEMPDVLYNSNHTANAYDPASDRETLGSKKHRHATIV